jgi:hypothetical protein
MNESSQQKLFDNQVLGTSLWLIRSLFYRNVGTIFILRDENAINSFPYRSINF